MEILLSDIPTTEANQLLTHTVQIVITLDFLFIFFRVYVGKFLVSMRQIPTSLTYIHNLFHKKYHTFLQEIQL